MNHSKNVEVFSPKKFVFSVLITLICPIILFGIASGLLLQLNRFEQYYEATYWCVVVIQALVLAFSRKYRGGESVLLIFSAAAIVSLLEIACGLLVSNQVFSLSRVLLQSFVFIALSVIFHVAFPLIRKNGRKKKSKFKFKS